MIEYIHVKFFFSANCNGKAVQTGDINNGGTINETCGHSHAPDVRDEISRVVKADIKQRVISSAETTRKVVANVLVNVNSPAVLMDLPSVDNLGRAVRHVRQTNNRTPTNPETIDELQLEENYTVTVNKEPFLLFDIHDDKHRTLIFATKQNLTFLLACESWYMDGEIQLSFYSSSYIFMTIIFIKFDSIRYV